MGTNDNPIATSRRTRAIRFVLAVLALGAWFWTQSLISHKPATSEHIGDGIHALTAPLHQFFVDNPRPADALLIVSSAFIDLLAIFLFASAIFGPTIRPFLGMLIIFVLRQICQAFCTLTPPAGMIWHYPGFPSLLVTYGVSNDLFFSGHTAIAVLGATELARVGKRWLTALGVAVALFEIATVIVLRAHYTMDVFAGALTALFVAGIVSRLAVPCDRALARE